MTATGKSSFRVRVLGSVRFRLALTVFLIVGISMLIGGTLLVKWVEITLLNDVRERNEHVVSYLAEQLAKGHIPRELFAPVLEGEARDEVLNSLLGVSANTRDVLENTYFYLEGRGLTDLNFDVDSQGRVGLFGRTGPPPKVAEHSLDVSTKVDTIQGTLTLHAVTPTTEIERSVGALRGALVLTLPILAMSAGIMTWFITGRALAPVAAMTRRVRELSATNLDARVPIPPTSDEIAQLAVTMNEMLDRLQHASIAQRQFVSDASHELRSPVASIRAQLETALQYPDKVDWPEVARIVLVEDARLEHLVGNLLAMARLEEGRMGPRSEIDLDELIMIQTKRMMGVKLDLSGVSGGRVWGNPDELTSVIRNLLDNAARYATSRIAVSVSDQGPWVTMTVSDDGPGIAPEHRDKVFQRFARLQEGRERDMGGTGLGLALSKRIVEQHNGEIFVEENEPHGARFIVRLPSVEWTGSHPVVEMESVEYDTGGVEPGDGPGTGI
ncbi:MAG: HAMP domain-containing histidine kinase [Microthrixaceae bacterium]|nr:HAMP domain-containing histidine kinase [Microthrixaceae bacterium]